jgi:putative protease
MGLVPHPIRHPELLSPAGDWESLRAAVANGADAVYFGLPQFNARHRATNFRLDELPAIMQFLHRRNVRGYIAFNTLIFSDELPAAVDYIRAIAEAGADAVIVQDLGLARLIRQCAPTLPIHGSTQMTLTEPRGVTFVRERLGIDRVILARELSAADVSAVAAESPIPVEVFVHGALCVAYSGQCLTSEALGGRSANRGQCAQACRLPYEMIVDGSPRDLGDRAYLLSPQDLAAYDLIEPLTEAGVVSFKIEGRLKTPHYVAATTQTYRAALDAAIEKREFALSPDGRRDLEQCFSRGLMHGFLDGVNHQLLVQGRFPKSRGVRVGTVTGVSRHGVIVEFTEPDLVRPGDGVVFDCGHPEEQESGGRVYEVRGNQLSFARDFDLTAIPIGAIVWKTDDPALRHRLEQSFVNDEPFLRAPLSVRIHGTIGGPLSADVRADGRTVSVTWPGPLEVARKHPLTDALLRDQFGRLGDTPYQLAATAIEITGEALVPKSVLNDLRRRSIAELLALRDAVRHEFHPSRKRERRVFPLPAGSTELVVLCRTLDQLDAVLSLDEPPALVYCELEDLRRYGDAVARARAAHVPIGLATLRIQKPHEEGHLRLIASFEPDVILVRNLAGLTYFRAEHPTIPLVGDFSLNVANELSAELFHDEGLVRIVPSYDLNWTQLSALVEASDPNWFEVVVHQHMPMFHMEHCVFAAFLSDGKDWRDCGRPCDRHRIELRDRVGAAFPVVADTGCRNTVFNSLPQSAAEFLPRMLGLGLHRFRIELLRETPEAVGPLIERYARILSGSDDGRGAWRQLQALNQLGVTRGTLQMV